MGARGPRYGELHEAAQKKPNNFSLYDMIGNVWEWTADWYADHYYDESPMVVR